MDNPPPAADDCMKLSSSNTDDPPEDDDCTYLSDESDESRFSDEPPPMTDEQRQEYYNAVIESEGFDVPVFPNTGAIGRIDPIHNLEIRMDEFKKAGNKAIEQYNKKNETAFEISELIKVNVQAVNGMLYYMTFKAKPIGTPTDFHTTTFQALVHRGVSCLEWLAKLKSLVQPSIKKGKYLPPNKTGGSPPIERRR